MNGFHSTKNNLNSSQISKTQKQKISILTPKKFKTTFNNKILNLQTKGFQMINFKKPKFFLKTRRTLKKFKF